MWYINKNKLTCTRDRKVRIEKLGKISIQEHSCIENGGETLLIYLLFPNVVKCTFSPNTNNLIVVVRCSSINNEPTNWIKTQLTSSLLILAVAAILSNVNCLSVAGRWNVIWGRSFIENIYKVSRVVPEV